MNEFEARGNLIYQHHYINLIACVWLKIWNVLKIFECLSHINFSI